ncbi:MULTISPECIES: RadC family protein [Pseudobacillus]|uniref:JAB domain-containing protein n=1 Tax=Pseudobacillus TaxID=108525 RepID=UPI00387A2C96
MLDQNWLSYIGPNQADLFQILHALIGEEAEYIRQYSIGRLYDMSISELEEEGLTKQSAIIIKSAFALGERYNDYQAFTASNRPIKSASDAYALGKWIANKDREHFLVVYLNAAQVPIHRKVVSIGTVNSLFVHQREIFKDAFRESAASLILYHNHPSGQLVESEQDVELTQRVLQTAEILGFQVFDHLIVTTNGYLSLRNKGYFAGKELSK